MIVPLAALLYAAALGLAGPEDEPARSDARAPVVQGAALAAKVPAEQAPADTDSRSGSSQDLHVLQEYVTEIRRFNFDDAHDDRDYDRQPDEWTRRKGLQFPEHVLTRLDPTTGSGDKQSLKFELNGGQAAYYSPLIRIADVPAIILHAQIRTEGMKYDAAVVSLSFLDPQRKRVRRAVSRPVTGTHSEWVNVEVGPIPVTENVRFLVIGCHISGLDQHDVAGNAWFDSLWVGSLPDLKLQTPGNRHYFQYSEPIAIDVSVPFAGAGKSCDLQVSIEDEQGQVCHQEAQKILPVSPAAAATSDPAALPADPSARPTKPAPEMHWELPALPIGFYRVRARVERGSVRLLEKTTTLCVRSPSVSGRVDGEFGWSMSAGAGEASWPILADLAADSGLNWLKLPLWQSAHAELTLTAPPTGLLLDSLDQRGLKIVGLLNDPPGQLTDKFAQQHVGAARIFSMPRDLWSPALEPVIARYSFRIHHWQVTDETDESFVGFSHLGPTFRTVKQDFDRIGHHTLLGARWSWEAPPAPADVPLSFVSLPPLEGPLERLTTELQKMPANRARWVQIQPALANIGTVEARTIDLTQRILAAKLGNAEGIFATNPLDPQTGLLQPDGAPTELYLPWRTYALALRGTKYLGKLELTNRSSNLVFGRDKHVVIAVWNNEPGEELLYVGEQITVLDPWGRSVPTEMDPATGQCKLKVGPVPLLVTGCSGAIVQWQLAVKFQKGRIPSEYGSHEEALLVTNTFTQGVNGHVRLRMPKGWEVEPNHWVLQAAAGENIRLPMMLKFPVGFPLGSFRPTVEFEIGADRNYQFVQPLPCALGTGDVELDVRLRRVSDTRLEVEQRITNNTVPWEDLSFTCNLFVPGQIRQKLTATKVGKSGDIRLFYVGRPDLLKGQELWINIEQIDGRRVLNRRVKVE